jgi:ABC-type nitrate/sulfonate/bicarbonate transport system substrate-binding protein
MSGKGVVASIITALSSAAARVEPLRIGYVVWVSFGPLFLAQEKGFFTDEGAHVAPADFIAHRIWGE